MRGRVVGLEAGRREGVLEKEGGDGREGGREEWMGLDEGGGVFGWRGMREEGVYGMEEVGRCGKRLRREDVGGGRRREGRRGHG